MLLVSDVHGADDALRKVIQRGEPVLVLGDLINFIDYRTYEGIVTDVAGVEFVHEMVSRRDRGDTAGARALWGELSAGREDELRADLDRRIHAAYRSICSALEGGRSYVTYGNVDNPALMAKMLPNGAEFIDCAVVEIEGWKVGFAGGGMVSVKTPGEITEDQMADKLDSLGRVDILCTHVPPAVPQLAKDVVGGRQKGSAAIIDYLERAKPPFHYFGDIHQPQAVRWRVADTWCRNVGYFRATGKAVRHG